MQTREKTPKIWPIRCRHLHFNASKHKPHSYHSQTPQTIPITQPCKHTSQGVVPSHLCFLFLQASHATAFLGLTRLNLGAFLVFCQYTPLILYTTMSTTTGADNAHHKCGCSLNSSKRKPENSPILTFGKIPLFHRMNDAGRNMECMNKGKMHGATPES